MSLIIKNWNQEVHETVEALEMVISAYKIDIENIQNQLILINNDQNYDSLKISLENQKQDILNGIKVLEQTVLRMSNKFITCC